jgi:ribosomal protein L29
MSFCPLIKDRCKREECMFWVKKPVKPAFEWIRCAFQVSPFTLPIIEEEEASSEELDKEYKKFEKTISELKKKSPEEVAKELIDFIQKQYPKAITDPVLQRDVFELFWAKRLPSSVFYRYPELQQLKTAVESMVKINLRVSGLALTTQEGAAATIPKALEELRERSVEEIVDDILEFWKRDTSRYVTPIAWELLRDYLREKGLEYSSIFEMEKAVGIELGQKLRKVESMLSIKLFEERERETAKKIDELVQSLLPKFKGWLMERGISRISRNVVEVFLQEMQKEGNITLPPLAGKRILIETLYLYAKTNKNSGSKAVGREYKVWSME